MLSIVLFEVKGVGLGCFLRVGSMGMKVLGLWSGAAKMCRWVLCAMLFGKSYEEMKVESERREKV